MVTLVFPQSANSLNQNNVNKVLVTAAFGGVEVTVDNSSKAPEHPLSKVATYDFKWPILITESGPIWDATAISCYVARIGNSSDLLGSTPFEEAQVRQWLEYSTSELHLAVISVVYPLRGLLKTSKQEAAIAEGAALQALSVLNSHLLNNTYLVGKSVTVADIVIALTVIDLYSHVLTEEQCKKNSNVTRWFLTCLNQPAFRTVLGSPSFHANEYLKSIECGAKSAPAAEESAAQEEAEADTQAKDQPASGTEENEVGDSGTEESGEESGGEAGGEAGGASPKTLALRRKIRKERKNKKQIVAGGQPGAVAPVVHPFPRKVTEKDLFSHAIPSQYHSPQATKEKAHKHANAPSAIRNISQPK